MNPCLLSVHDHQVILGKIEERENLNHDEYVSSQVYDSNEKNFPLVLRAKRINPCHGKFKTSIYASN